MLISLAVAGNPSVATIIAILLVNARHVLYGTVLGPAFRRWPEGATWLSAFGLTDEVFAVTSTRALQDPPAPPAHLTLVYTCYASWMAGTAAGVLVGGIIPPPVSRVLGFALAALFLALLFLDRPSASHVLAAAVGALIAAAASLYHASSLGLVAGALLGATVGAVFHGWLGRRQTLK